MNRYLQYTCLLLLTVLLSGSCSTDFEVFAPEEPIVAVYSVLNPEDSLQYVVVSGGFQVEGDAVEYAAGTDLSLSDLVVTMTGNGVIYNAEEVDSFPIDSMGAFPPQRTVYRFLTNGDAATPFLEGGQTYTLEVGTPEDSIHVTGSTIIPDRINLDNQILGTFPGPGQERCMRKLPLNADLEIRWTKGDFASAYELRVILNYEADGVSKTATWVTSSLIEENRGCGGGSTQFCYEIVENTLLQFFQSRLKPGEAVYTYDDTPECVPVSETEKFPKSVKFEISALDQNIRNFMIANDPSFPDLTGAKPEWTHLEGNVRTIGVFGSVASDFEHVILNDCSEYILGLNNTPKPANDCDEL